MSRACAPLPLLLLAASLAAAGIDLGAVDDPRRIQFGDRALENRWASLYEPDPRWPSRAIGYLARNAGDQALSLLATRLLYAGDPWSRRGGESAFTRREWRRRTAEVRAAILRELRFHAEPGLADVYLRYLVGEDEPDLVVSALVNLTGIDQDRARAAAVRLVDAQRPDALPGAAEIGVRQQCVAFLVEGWGVDDSAADVALRAGITAGGRERNHALALIPRGHRRDLLEATAATLLEQRRRGDLDGDAVQALVLITDRLDGIADGAVAAGFADLAVHADRELAIAAATVLSQGARWDLPLPVDTIAGRANGVADFALRHALIGLLLRLKPNLVREVAGADSPWRQLASHRERLAAWEWEGMVR